MKTISEIKEEIKTPSRLKSILWGALAALMIFCVSLTILCGLIGG